MPNPKFKTVKLADGRTMVVTPRPAMKGKNPIKHARRPNPQRPPRLQAPLYPQTWDWTNPGTYPVLDNSQYGDCMMAAACHGEGSWTALSSSEWIPAVSAVVAAYQQLSGGDNGLSDDQLFPQWKTGLLGAGDNHKITDYMLCNVNDPSLCSQMGYLFGGLFWECALLDTWIANPAPDQLWDAGGTPDQAAGHGMWITARLAGNQWRSQTWGFVPGVRPTDAGIQSADSELLACFSLDWFNGSAVAGNGMSYDQLRQAWIGAGGHDPGPWPGPTPIPVTPNLLQQILDGIFKFLETVAAPFPAVQSLLVQVQAWIDNLFVPAKPKIGRRGPIHDFVMMLINWLIAQCQSSAMAELLGAIGLFLDIVLSGV